MVICLSKIEPVKLIYYVKFRVVEYFSEEFKFNWATSIQLFKVSVISYCLK